MDHVGRYPALAEKMMQDTVGMMMKTPEIQLFMSFLQQRIPLVGHHLERGRAEQEEELHGAVAATNAEEWFVAKWEQHCLEGKIYDTLEGEERRRTLGNRLILLPGLIDIMRREGDPDVPQAWRTEDRGSLIRKMHAEAEDLARQTGELPYTIPTLDHAVCKLEHVGAPWAPLPADGLHGLERMYSYISIDEMEVVNPKP